LHEFGFHKNFNDTWVYIKGTLYRYLPERREFWLKECRKTFSKKELEELENFNKVVQDKWLGNRKMKDE